ncbi:gliding motility-associated C-terminal domain-containing protein, partial [Pedobacter sp. Hv1]|uniref:T9SS type B sorting domain-containing protein n=1 Tax=Pedobacter sp. Hv1 TaxID=1740090 RepID=UPI0006D8AE52
NNTATSTPVPVPIADVTIAKVASNSTPNVGSNVTFTLTANNNGPSDATGVNVTDLLPSGYTFVSANPSTGTYNNVTGIWNIGTLTNGVSATIDIIATVKASGSYANTATITATQTDPTPTNNTATSTPVPVPMANLAITKTVSNPTPNVGSNVTFTLTANNNGPSDASHTIVNDLLPNGYTFVSASPFIGVYDQLTGIWDIGNLANGANATLTVVATVRPNGNYVNSAIISASEDDPDHTDNVATSTPTPIALADISITKTVSNTSPIVGSNITFTITVNNAGPSNATNVMATDLLPTGYTFVSAVAPVGTTYNNTTGLWNIGTLANGTNVALNITATVNAIGNFTNTATVVASETDPTPTNNTATSTPTPVPVADVAITKTANNTAPNVGNNVTFTITATNTGPSSASNVKVNDLLPNGYTFLSATPAVGNYDPITGIWNIGTLANSANSTLNIIATVNATGNYANTATITATETDPTPTNNTATSTPVPVPVADVAITKTASNSTPNVGSNVTFTIRATNAGPSNATNIIATDVLPNGYTFVSANASTGAYDQVTGKWMIGTLVDGANATLDIVAKVNATGSYANTVTITATETDPTLTNNTATSTPVPMPVADVSVLKTISKTTPSVGANVTFTLTASNTGPNNATNVNVSDLLPSGYTFVSFAASVGTYNNVTGLWSIGNLANGANASLSIVATVNASGNHTNAASVSAAEHDPNTTNNTSSVTSMPVDVKIAKTGPAIANAGTMVSYKLTISNEGTGNALSNVIDDVVPATLSNVNWTATAQGSSTINSGAIGTGNHLVVNANIPAGAGNTITIDITGQIPANTTATSLSNTATVASPDPSDPIINSNTVTTTIGKNADIQIQKTGPSAVIAGNAISYIIKVSNAGPSDVNNVNIIDNIPTGINSVTWTATAENGATLTGANSGIGNINLFAAIPSGTATITITVNGIVDHTYVGTTLNNTATATPEAGIIDPTPATSTVITNVTRVANVRITKSGPANIGAGEVITYNLHIVNDGPSDAIGVQIADVIPSQVLNPTWTATALNGATVSTNNGSGNINITGNIPSGTGTIDITITGTINPSTSNASTFNNTATASFPTGSPITDPEPSSNTSTIPTLVNNTANIRVSKNGPANVNVLDPITYTIVVTNAGLGNVAGAIITDNVPADVTVSSWSALGTGGATITGATSGNSNAVNTIGNIPADPNAKITITINGMVNSSAASIFTNTVTVTAGGNPQSSVTTAVNKSTDVQIDKNGTQTAIVGSTVSYTIKVSNNGPIAANGITINDIVPAEIENVSWKATAYGTASLTGPDGTGITGNTIQTTGNVPIGVANYIMITVNGNIKSSVTVPSISNTATITLPPGLTDFDLSNQGSTVVTTLTKESDVSITKTASNNAPVVGSQITFNIVASNTGPSDATIVKVNDVLTNGYTFVSATPSIGTFDNATGVWTIGGLTKGANATLNMVASVNASGSYTNTASITAAETDPNTSNSATVTPVPSPLADVSITKTVDNLTPNVGSNITFTLTAKNAGPSTATGVTANDILPSGYTFVSASAAIGTNYNSTNGVWTIGSLANGASSILTITATVKTTGNYTNTATISATETDPTLGNNSASVTPVPISMADVSVIKTVSDLAPSVGSTIMFTIKAANAGPSNTTGVTVTDLLPSGYTFVSANAPAGTTYNATTGLWSIGNLANGANASLTITAKVSATGNYTNTATISATETDPTLGNNSSSVTPMSVPEANVAVIKTVSNANPNVGSNVTFTITASNAGPSNATGVMVNDLLPSGYTFVSATAQAGTTYNNTTGLWSIGNLANGANAILTVTAKVNAVGLYANTATITANEDDPDHSDNSATATPTPISMADVSVVKTTSDTAPPVGNTITFTIKAANAGPSNATGVTITDLLPSGYTFVSANAPAGTTYNATTGLWSIGNLVNGTNVSLTITAKVNAAGNYTNTATISATEIDPTPGNNSSSVSPIPVPEADVTVIKTVSNANPNVGSNVTFTIKATNTGLSNATGVKVNDLLPSGYDFVSATAQAGTTYNSTTGLWSIGNLANGANAILTVTAKVNAIGLHTNTATIIANEDDPDPSNNSSTVTPIPTAAANVSISKTVNNMTPAVGTNVTFTITAANAGPSMATGVNVTDILSNGYTFITANAPVGTTYNSTTGLWVIGNLANGANAILTITAKVNNTGPYTNTATITSTTLDPDPSNNSATVMPVPASAANVSVNKTVDNATPTVGTNVTFTITAANAGPSTATGVNVTDILPTGYTYVSATAPLGTTYNSMTGLWAIGTLANGSSTSLNITATVNASGNYTNTATISATTPDLDLSNNSSSVTPITASMANVSVHKTVNNASPVVGSNVVFSITAANAGPSMATGVTVTDILPTGYTFVSANAPAGTTYNNNTGLWTIGSLANGANAILTITAKVNATGLYANTATININEDDPDLSNNSSTVTPAPASTANISVSKTVDNLTPTVGSNVVFSIRIANNGPSVATAVTVTDILPSGYTFISANAPAGTTYNSTNGLWSIGNLTNGANVVLNIIAKVNATGPYANTATVTSATTDPNPSDNSSTVTPIPASTADISVNKTVNNTNPTIGSNVVFSISVTNNGPSNATGVLATDILPSGYTFISANAPAGTTYNNTTGLWSIGNLTNGVNTILTITAKVNATGLYANTATVTSTTPDPDPSNNSSTVTLVTTAMAKVAINKTINNMSPVIGSNVVFSIRVVNNGPSDATGILATDILPSGYTFISANAPAGNTYNSTSGLWTIGTLANGADAILTITAKVNATGLYANTATVVSTSPDPDLSDNSSTVTPIPVKPDFVELKIPNLFTPNGDGKNDMFEIIGLSQFRENSLVIVNRWENQVYHATNYQNNWTGEGLNEGTYFYLLKVKRTDNSEWVIYKGYITLVRTFKK